jgi:hypothetical protein
MPIYAILKWNGNVWVLEGKGFVRKDKAISYCKGNDALQYKKITVDVDCG